jgi:GABA(A) receptor-associated protein
MWKYITTNVPTSSKSGFEFKMQNSFEKRKEESTRLNKKYPDKILVIVEKSESSLLPSIKDQKFLINKDITIGQFLYIIRSRIKLDPSEAIFLIINDKIVPATGDTIGKIYEEHADRDGFLYIAYAAQMAYGFKF